MYDIDWCEYDLLKPRAGMATTKEGESVYFHRLDVPTFVSSVSAVPLPAVNVEESKTTFRVYRLRSEDAVKLQEEHLDFCERTGAPKKHGDPWIISSTSPGSIRRTIGLGTINGCAIGDVASEQFANFNLPATFVTRAETAKVA